MLMVRKSLGFIRLVILDLRIRNADGHVLT